jgi:hypothetical protein
MFIGVALPRFETASLQQQPVAKLATANVKSALRHYVRSFVELSFASFDAGKSAITKRGLLEALYSVRGQLSESNTDSRPGHRREAAGEMFHLPIITRGKRR